MNQPQRPKRPRVPRETRGDTTYHPPQEMADPMGHLRGEMKKKFLERYIPDYGPNGPPVPAEPTAPKPTES